MDSGVNGDHGLLAQRHVIEVQGNVHENVTHQHLLTEETIAKAQQLILNDA